MFNRHRGHGLAGPQVGDRLAGDRGAVESERLRRLEIEQRVHVGCVPLPGDRSDAESLAEEEAVAGMQGVGERELGRRAVERAGQQAASAIGHVDHQRTVAGRRIERAHQHEVAAEADAAVGAAVGALEVGDASVVLQQRIDRVAQPGTDQLKGSMRAKLPAVGVGTLVGDVNAFNGHWRSRFIGWAVSAAWAPQGYAARASRAVATRCCQSLE